MTTPDDPVDGGMAAVAGALRGDLRVLARLRDRATMVTKGQGYTVDQMGRDMRRVFLGSDEGERVAMVILGWAGFWTQPLVPGQPDMTAYNLGRRQVGLELWHALAERLPGRDDDAGGPIMAEMERPDAT